MLRRNPIALAVVLGVLSPACGPAASEAFRNRLPGAEAPSPPGDLVFSGAGFDLHTAGTVSPATFDATWKGVLATLNRYLDAGVLTPLRSGGPAGDLTPLFTASAAARVMTPGPERAAFIDEGLAPATAVRRDAAVATLTALAGTDGAMSVVTARLDLRLRAEVDGTPLSIARTGELVLMPEGGTWKIDAYDIRVSRDTVATTTITTARS